MSEVYKSGDRVLVVVTLLRDGVDEDGDVNTDKGYFPAESIVGRVQSRYVLFDEAK